MNSTQKQQILQLYKEVMKRVLIIGQSSLPESQFKAFRKIILDEFSWARRELEIILDRYGQARVCESDCKKAVNGRCSLE